MNTKDKIIEIFKSHSDEDNTKWGFVDDWDNVANEILQLFDHPVEQPAVMPLLPCPFCGSEPFIDRREAAYIIMCPECVTVQMIANEKQIAIQRWNNRNSSCDLLEEYHNQPQREEVKFTQTPAEYFESRNGGKSAEKMMDDEEIITPTYALTLISEYVLDCIQPQREVTDKEIREWANHTPTCKFNKYWTIYDDARYRDGLFDGAICYRNGKIGKK